MGVTDFYLTNSSVLLELKGMGWTGIGFQDIIGPKSFQSHHHINGTNAQGGSQLCSTWGGKLQHRTGKPTLHRSQTLPLQYRSDECSSSARVGDTNLDTKNLQKGYKKRQTKLILNQMLSYLFQGEPNWAQQTTIPFSWISVVTFRDGLRSKQ